MRIYEETGQRDGQKRKVELGVENFSGVPFLAKTMLTFDTSN